MIVARYAGLGDFQNSRNAGLSLGDLVNDSSAAGCYESFAKGTDLSDEFETAA